ncbi:hypothetical protein AB1Y20_016229 [Prymnesium parvum]|uniref:Uncharacterized protein n=1 Tax=Prymnesium parvum TaxID=97485 RepID=A0AB34IEM4_PRYPA
MRPPCLSPRSHVLFLLLLLPQHTSALLLPHLRSAVSRAAAPPLVAPLLHPRATPRAPPASLFADQAGSLAGALFPASLPPYLLFLYFLCQDVNGLSDTAKAGFSSLLLFVAATVVTSIASVKSYGLSLANVDWLHGGAEQLLTYTNIAEVIGLKLTLDRFSSSSSPSSSPSSPPVVALIGGAAALTLGLTYAAAPSLGAHAAFLGGVGDLPDAWAAGFAQPQNALSLPTWVIHLSSLLEWLVAMGLVWRIGIASGNPRWKGLTWAMIPSHSSGVCACVYHFFYNAESLQFIVLMQAALTLLGNCTLAYAAWRLAVSNGWSFSLSPSAPYEAASIPSAAAPRDSGEADDTARGLLLVLAWSIGGSYAIKYGETLLPFVKDGDAATLSTAAVLMVAGVTGFNVWKWSQRSRPGADDFEGLI